MTQIEAAHEWKEQYCHKHKLFRKTRHGSTVPDIIAAPEPTDEDLGWPEPMVTVTWPTGYVTMTLAALLQLLSRQHRNPRQHLRLPHRPCRHLPHQ